ncbi:hypothetical protein QOZ80_UnG0725170 [Eleusine coracana subsp. coracana]|uniref:Uncharacterized protein n=1 Tax=Eleusine coracana subsp. coracana TaxID=191504 RepID=A0AAV9FYS1_ELECO|nr:hypothetical protein QOZ80_UnG0725170 [Eleusine coracana subsp. coracana]
MHGRKSTAWPGRSDNKTTIDASTWRPTISSSVKGTDDAEKLGFIEEITRNVGAVQERVLSEILGRNGESEYLKECGLAGATDRASFRAKVPMVTYKDLEPYIRRIADGDRSPILTGPGYPVSEFFTSSGTSGGERKLLPCVEDETDRRQLLHNLLMSVMKQHVPGHDTGSDLFFLFVQPERKMAGGLPARTALTSVIKSQHLKSSSSRTNTSRVAAAILCEDTFQSMYAQMLYGLCQRQNISCVGAVFAAGLLRAMRFLQLNWEQLAADVETGVLSARVTDKSVREAVMSGILLRPDPDLAQFIRDECSTGDWAGIVKRMWPNTKYLSTVITGSMAQYIPSLNYFGGGLPIVSTLYASSECTYGINLRPMCDPGEVSYTFIPFMGYFEFLPVDDYSSNNNDASHQQLVDLARLEMGREYEVVVTTYAGLNRYRVGDVLRVTGFHNSAPRLLFVRRKNVVLSVDSDKTDEAELQRAVERASTLLLRLHGSAAVVEYTSRACANSIPGHYIVYWELMLSKEEEMEEAPVMTMSLLGGDVLDRCCLEMEEALSSVYRRKRVVENAIAPLEIRVVQSGTFEELMDYAVSRGTSMSQYKVPRCVTESPHIIELLDSRVVSSHFSPMLPRWAPAD